MPKSCSGAKPSAKLAGTIALLAALFCLFLSVPPAFAQDQPVIISNVKVEPNPFSPNDDGNNELTKFSYTLSEASVVTIELVWFTNVVQVNGVKLNNTVELQGILQLGGDSTRHYASDTIFVGTANSGLNEFVWDGKLDPRWFNDVRNVWEQVPYTGLDTLQVPDSTYTYLIRAEDVDTDDQFKTQPVVGKVQIDSKPPVISSVTVSPNPYSPNGDNINDEANIGFTLTGLPTNAQVANIAFKINYDTDGNPISFAINPAGTTAKLLNSDTVDVPFAPRRLHIIPKSKNTAEISFVLRGGLILESSGTTRDTINITANVTIPAYDPENLQDRSLTSTGKFSYIDTVFNVVGQLTDNPSNLVEIRTFAGNVHVEVNNSANETVIPYVELDPPFIGNGDYTATMNVLLPDDTYSYIITAVDESGNLVRQTGQVTAISEPLQIVGLDAFPDTVSPADANNRSDFTTIGYSLNRDSEITMQIFRDSTAFVQTNLVRTLLTSSFQQAGPHAVSWNGKNDVGAYVSQGVEKNYRIIVSAFDPKTFETTESRTTVRIDNHKPDEIVISTVPNRTRESILELDGHATANDTVRMFLNSEQVDIFVADGIGLFNYELDLGGDGVKRIYAHAYDHVGNGPTVSDTQTVLLDTQPPVVLETMIRSGGERNILGSETLLSFGPSDTLEMVIVDTSGSAVGVQLDQTTLRLAGPSGREIPGTIKLVQPDTVRFIPLAVQTAEGTDTLIATFADSLGNRAGLRVVFNLGQAQPAPSLDSLSANLSHNGFLNSRLDLAGQGNQWVITAHVRDNSNGSGIDSASSSMSVIHRASQKVIDGSWRVVGDNLVFTVSQNIATDGSMDGWYVAYLLVNDKDDATGTLQTTDSLLNDTRLPDTLSVDVDSLKVGVTLRDLAGGSGVNLLQSTVDVRPPTGVTLPSLFRTNDGDSTLFAEFDPPLSEVGIYSLDITVFDRAGNQRTVTRQFTIGSGKVQPRISESLALFGIAARTQDLTQPLKLWVRLDDVSGVGIDWTATTAVLLAQDSSEVESALSNNGDSLIVTLTNLLSNSGQDDGRYTLSVHAVDRVGGEADSSVSFLLDNLAPDTSGLVFVGDSSTIRVTIMDRPAAPGIDSSGAQILSATASLSNPSGAVVPSTTAHDGFNTLIVNLTDGKPEDAGIYTLAVSVSDFAGNQRNRQITFPMNVTAILDVYPPDSSLVTGPLGEVVVGARGLLEEEAPGDASTIQVARNSVVLSGTSTIEGDSLIFTFPDTLATDGTGDGLYTVTAFVDAASLGTSRNVKTIFTVDNLPPDTVSSALDPSSGGTLVTVVLDDGGVYPYVAGIDQDATSAVVIDPSGRESSPLSRRWLDDYTIEFSLAAFGQAGLHKLRLTAADRAGQTALFTIPVVNNQGAGQGASTAFVEEVPARTSANISFVSGRADATITRAVLRIFNLRGDLVRKVDVSDRIGQNGSLVNAEWLLDNDGGEYVNNGVFIYYWEVTFSDGRTERIKKTLAVARR